MKPYYNEGDIQIYLGNCLTVMEHLPEVDMILTDPPWNLGYFEDDNKSWEDYSKWLNKVKVLCESKADTVFIFQSTKAIPYVAHNFKGWSMFANPKNFCQMTPKHMPNAFDLAFFNSHKCYSGKGRNWHIGNNAKISNTAKGHPTARPTDSMKYIVNLFTCDTILDPFMGSGTTLVAAKELGRKAIGTEIEEKYVKIAIDRLSQEVFPFKERS